MEFKGTKGEWKLSLPKTEGVVLMNGNVRAQVLSFGNSGLNEEDLANAKLIACAPEMLEKLIYLIEMVEHEDVIFKDNLDNDGNESIFGKLFTEIISTVKKATTI